MENRPAFILFTFLLAVMDFVLWFITGFATKKKMWRYISVLMLIFTGISAINIYFCSDKIFLLAGVTPFWLLFSLFGAISLKQYKNCSLKIPAKYCSSYIEHHYRAPFSPTRRPQFTYTYNGQTYTSYSFHSCSKRSIERRFSETTDCTIHINPDAPHQCVDKRQRPTVLVFGTIFFSLLACGTIAMAFLI